MGYYVVHVYSLAVLYRFVQLVRFSVTVMMVRSVYTYTLCEAGMRSFFCRLHCVPFPSGRDGCCAREEHGVFSQLESCF